MSLVTVGLTVEACPPHRNGTGGAVSLVHVPQLSSAMVSALRVTPGFQAVFTWVFVFLITGWLAVEACPPCRIGTGEAVSFWPRAR